MKIIFVFAHPDDESFSSGGTISKLVKKGIEVKLITATRGEAGKTGDPNLICTPDELGKIRTKELECAAKVLGISQIFYLDFIDATLEKLPSLQLEKSILEILNNEKPDVVVTFDKTGGSNHPDHKAVSRSATEAFRKYLKTVDKHVRLYHTATPQRIIKMRVELGFAYSAFGKMMGTPDEEITTVVDINEAFDTKIKALQCHQTQHNDWERMIALAKKLNLKQEYFRLISENSLY